MSFIQSICGPATSNEFVFSTSSVSSDNASFINLSVLGDATIVTLSTTNFSPTTLDAQVLTAVNGTIASFQSTSSYISNLSVSSMSVDNLSVGEVDIELLDVGTIEVDRLKIMDNVNANYSQLVRANDIFTIAGGYFDPSDPSVIYEGQINITSGAGAARAINISLNKANISGNVIDAITTNSVSVNASELYSDSVTAIDVDADEGNFGTVNSAFLNVSTLGVSDIVTENISVINASVNNLSVYHTLDIKDQDGSNNHGSIYNNTSGLHIAGNGEPIRIRAGGDFDQIVLSKTLGQVNISNLNTSTITGIDVTLTGTMDSTTVIANDINSNEINTSLLNVSNISVDEDISCEQLVCADVICNDVTTNFLFDVDLTNNLSAGQGITIVSVNDVPVISLQDPMNISTITAENMNVSGSAANFFDGANIYGTATVTNLVSDLTNTLSAGSNITITSVGGKAQISSSGGGGGTVPDPLNLSQLNASNISVDLNIDAEDITAINKVEGFLVLGETVESNGNMICGDDLTVGNKTITKRLQYNPSSLFWQVSSTGPQPGGGTTQLINFDGAIWDKTGGVFGRQGVGFLVNVSGWYKCSAHVQFWKISGSQTQAIRTFFTVDGDWLPARGATFSSTAFLNGNARYGNTSLTNTIFFNVGEEVTVAYQSSNQPGANFGSTIGSTVSAVGSFIYMEYLGGSFNF